MKIRKKTINDADVFFILNNLGMILNYDILKIFISIRLRLFLHICDLFYRKIKKICALYIDTISSVVEE